MRENHGPPVPPEQSAAELKELARQTDDPGERAWYLQWAKAFDRLAELRSHKRKRRPKPN